jgi:hypothetical protein
MGGRVHELVLRIGVGGILEKVSEKSACFSGSCETDKIFLVANPEIARH